MNYAVLQQTLEFPDLECMKRAFRSVPGLVPADALMLRNDAFGILIKGQSAEEASAMQGALRTQGIETLIVPESELPELPATKFVHRVECLESGLRVYDSIGRDFVVPWVHLTMIAAGNVTTQKFERVRTERPLSSGAADVNFNFNGFQIPVDNPPVNTVVSYDTKEKREAQLQLELILGKNVARYTIIADKTAPMLFEYLNERRTTSAVHNFIVLVRDLIQHAPQAMLNRGALQLRDGGEQVFAYPSKNAFFEEMIWFLWQWPEARRKQV